jgi:hypothetical protein
MQVRMFPVGYDDGWSELPIMYLMLNYDSLPGKPTLLRVG